MNKKIKELYNFLSGHPDIELYIDEPMKAHTSFKVGGPAELFCVLKTANVLVRALEKARELDIEPFIIGNGSNILVDDEGIPGVVFKVADDFWTINGEYMVANAGNTLASLTKAAKRAGLSGLEFTCGIPGTLGGAVYMNAGAYDGEMSKIIESVTYIDPKGNIQTLFNEGVEFGYRTSYFKQNPGCVIISAKLKLAQSSTQEVEDKIKDYRTRRREKQPIGFPSAGSIFKRPEGHFVGALLEECGLKGYGIGGAQVSDKHAGFIVNRGNATCKDVKDLIAHIQETVFEEKGVKLECEVLMAPNRR